MRLPLLLLAALLPACTVVATGTVQPSGSPGPRASTAPNSNGSPAPSTSPAASPAPLAYPTPGVVTSFAPFAASCGAAFPVAAPLAVAEGTAAVRPRSGLWELYQPGSRIDGVIHQVGLWFDEDGRVWYGRSTSPAAVPTNVWKDGRAAFRLTDCTVPDARCLTSEVFDVAIASETRLRGTVAFNDDVTRGSVTPVTGAWIADLPRASASPSAAPDLVLDGAWTLTVRRPEGLPGASFRAVLPPVEGTAGAITYDGGATPKVVSARGWRPQGGIFILGEVDGCGQTVWTFDPPAVAGQATGWLRTEDGVFRFEGTREGDAPVPSARPTIPTPMPAAPAARDEAPRG